MNRVRFDPSGEAGIFLDNIESAMAEGAKSLLLIASENNGFTREQFDSRLNLLPLPIFGGIFPGILFGRKHYEKGSLVVPYPFEASVANIAGYSRADGSELVSPHADRLSAYPTVLIFVDGSTGQIGSFLDGVYDLLGTETKYIGGGAGFSDHAPRPCIFSNLGLMENHAQLVGMPRACEIGISGGWQKLAGPFIVTECDGRTVRSLDYKPAAETYLEIAENASRREESDFHDFFCGIIDAEGKTGKREFSDLARNYPIGIEKAETFICEPVAREGKFLVCNEAIPELTPLCILKATPESLIGASRNAAKKLAAKMPDDTEFHPIVFSCIVRSAYLNEKFAEEVDEIADSFDQGIIGALTFGQIANGSDGCLSLFNRSVVLGIPVTDSESRFKKAVNRISMQHALAMLVNPCGDLAKLLRQFLPQAARLVNCRSVHAWLKDEGGEMTHRYSYPAREYDRIADHPRLLDRIARPLEQMEIVSENAAIFHLFPIGQTGVLVMRRNSPLPEEFALALQPAIARLGEACLLAMNHARCERARDLALQDASRLAAEIGDARKDGANLAESERRFNFFLESIPLFVFWKDVDLKFQGCNGHFARLSGFPDPCEIRGKTGDLPFSESEEDRLVMQSHSPLIGMEKRLKNQVFSMSKFPMHDDEGKIEGVLTIFEDIGEKKEMEEALRICNSIFDNAEEGILVLDDLNRIVRANGAFFRMTGYGHEELQGMDLANFLELREDGERMQHSIESTGSWGGKIRGKRRNGEPFSSPLNICAVKNGVHRIALLGRADAIEKEDHHDHIAHFDPLTRLPNRCLLAEDLRKAILHADRSGSIFALAFLDLDDFKPVNDLHGHETGDKLLIEVAKRLKAALRGEDTIARLGGDEFVLLLTGIKDMSDVEITLSRVLSDLSSPYQVDAYVLKITASIGVTVYPFDHVDADMLLRHADQAMYLAKQSGRSRFQWFDSKLDMALRTRQERFSKLRLALEKSELGLHYQPKINLKTGAVIGLEALLRWQHPEDGLIGPMAFLPLAEQTTLILDIGKWILEEALRQMAQWISEGIDLPVSVNISAAHLKHPDFVGTLEEILARHPEVPPSKLELEILETTAIDDLDLVRDTMTACQKFGVSFSLDDFGTGYSSLAYLKQLPVETVKVDKRFVHDMKENTDDLSIIEGVISLARIFSKMVIAEGVETAEHGMLLVRLGCDFGQGYGIARPMPPHEVPNWLAQFNTPSVANGY